MIALLLRRSANSSTAANHLQRETRSLASLRFLLLRHEDSPHAFWDDDTVIAVVTTSTLFDGESIMSPIDGIEF